MIEQKRFLSTVFLCSEFKLENVYSGVNFCGKSVCGNFYLPELIFADRWKNRTESSTSTSTSFNKNIDNNRLGPVSRRSPSCCCLHTR